MSKNDSVNSKDTISSRALVAELLGTMALICAGIGSVILGQTVFGADNFVYTFMCAISMGFVLFAMIETFGPLSGGNFNPAITIALTVTGEHSPKKACYYIAAQLIGAMIGVMILSVIFYDNLHDFFTISENAKDTLPHFFSEMFGTFLLVAVVIGCIRGGSKKTGLAVGFLLSGMILATSSTMFANPAVDLARVFTSAACGISPFTALGYIAFGIIGAIIAAFVLGWMYPKSEAENE